MSLKRNCVADNRRDDNARAEPFNLENVKGMCSAALHELFKKIYEDHLFSAGMSGRAYTRPLISTAEGMLFRHVKRVKIKNMMACDDQRK